MEKKITTKFITKTAILLALALVFQMGLRGLGQPIVGPLVNFVLIISIYIVGTLSGIIVGSLTPFIAFIFGIMGFFPVVPFIIVGNILYVFSFSFFREKFNKGRDILAVILASFIKYIFLVITVRYVVVLFANVPPKIIAAFSIPQLYNALIGGFLALIVKTFLPKSMLFKS